MQQCKDAIPDQQNNLLPFLGQGVEKKKPDRMRMGNENS